MSDQTQSAAQDAAAQPTPPPGGNTSPDTNDGNQEDANWVKMPSDRFNERLERERQKTINSLLSELGVSDVDALQAVLNEHETLRKERMSELEQAQSELDTTRTKLTKVSEEKQALLDQIQSLKDQQLDQIRQSAILKHAQGAQHPDDVLAWVMSNHADEFAALVNSDGNLDDEKAKALVDQCATERREWFRLSPYPGSPPTANRGHSDGGVLEINEEELLEQGRRSLRF